MPVDDKYTNGAWYDAQAGAISRISYDESENEVIFSGIGGSDRERIPEEDFNPEDFWKVPEDALQDPVGVIEEMLDLLQTDSVPMELPMDDYVRLKCARQLVDVVENDVEVQEN